MRWRCNPRLHCETPHSCCMSCPDRYPCTLRSGANSIVGRDVGPSRLRNHHTVGKQLIGHVFILRGLGGSKLDALMSLCCGFRWIAREKGKKIFGRKDYLSGVEISYRPIHRSGLINGTRIQRPTSRRDHVGAGDDHLLLRRISLESDRQSCHS